MTPSMALNPPKHCAKPTQYDAQQPAEVGVLLGAKHVQTAIRRVKPAIHHVKRRSIRS